MGSIETVAIKAIIVILQLDNSLDLVHLFCNLTVHLPHDISFNQQ